MTFSLMQYIYLAFILTLYLLLFCPRAWTKFISKHQGPFQEKITWVTGFPVPIQITTSDWEYFKCITLVFQSILLSTLVFET
jgi:hypothetical protein